MAMQSRFSQPFRRSGSTVDPAEVAKFSKLSDEWWDPKGKMAPLHKINPLRLSYIRDAACRKFERNVKSLNCLAACASSISAAAPGCCASRSPGWARR